MSCLAAPIYTVPPCVQLVAGTRGTLLDNASEIEAGVQSVFRKLDRNADHALSRSDLRSYWRRLGEKKKVVAWQVPLEPYGDTIIRHYDINIHTVCSYDTTVVVSICGGCGCVSVCWKAQLLQRAGAVVIVGGSTIWKYYFLLKGVNRSLFRDVGVGYFVISGKHLLL